MTIPQIGARGEGLFQAPKRGLPKKHPPAWTTPPMARTGTAGLRVPHWQNLASFGGATMTPEEMRAAGRLATRTLADTVSHVEHVHRAAATRAFAFTAPASLPARVVHDGIATGIYAVIRGAGLAVGWRPANLSGLWRGQHRPAGSTPRSNLALAVLNATLGDELADQGSPLAIPMAVRRARADVAPRRDALEVAFPEATSKVAVFIHGLGETEESWRLHADRHGGGTESTYGSRLAHDLGYTPVYLRYNTGLHISENGRHLTALLDDVTAAWPAPVAELILVGHSMGGLVARSACHYAQQRSHSWVSTLRHVFYLGSPHLGAGLEQWVSRLSGVLAKLDESRPLASILDRRSAGIKDLRTPDICSTSIGAMPTGSQDVLAMTSPSSPGRTTMRSAPLSRRAAETHSVDWWATSSSSPQVPAVDPVEAGTSRSPSSTCATSAGCITSDLLNHPSVYEAMREWLDPTSCAESEVGSTLVYQ